MDSNYTLCSQLRLGFSASEASNFVQLHVVTFEGLIYLQYYCTRSTKRTVQYLTLAANWLGYD